METLTGTQKIHHAAGLYLEGIRDGNVWEALNAHTGASYTQHSTGVGDGQQGFADFFGPFLEANPIRDIQVIRAIEDGPCVFLHVYQSLNNGAAEWVTGDLFDTDDADKVIEHWDVIQAHEGKTVSGRTMVDGADQIEDLEHTQANKDHVTRYIETCLMGGEAVRLSEFVSSTAYAEHSPDVAEGIAGLAAREGRYWKIHKLIGQGNFVVTLCHTQVERSHFAVFDIYRLKNGLIVEHWDVTEKILAPEEWNNQGKF